MCLEGFQDAPSTAHYTDFQGTVITGAFAVQVPSSFLILLCQGKDF